MPGPKKSAKGTASEASDLPAQGKSVTFEDDDTEFTDSDEYSEDDDAVLLTEKVENKIFETLLQIKKNDPKLQNPETRVFNDSDFENEESDDNKSDANKGPKLTINRMLSKTLLAEGAEAFQEDDEDDAAVEENAEEGGSKGFHTYNDEMNQLKSEFLNAAKTVEEDDDELFVKSDKIDQVLDVPVPQIADAPVRENETISKYWGEHFIIESNKVTEGESLNEDEEFLKDYILNQRWRSDKLSNFDYSDRFDQIDEEDEEHVEKADEFEYKFEEEGGCDIVTHPRVIEDSVRKVDDKRKRERLEKKQRKLELLQQRTDELRRLKEQKRGQISQKLAEIAAAAGVELHSSVIDLDAPFDPQQHERDMQRLLGIGYDLQDDKQAHIDPKFDEQDTDLWWLCDYCNCGIPVGEMHHDCPECDNYTLCSKCLPLANHEHENLVAKVVAPANAPPVINPKDQMELEQMINEYQNLDYEDVIGDLKVKFKYRNVEPFKCNIEAILNKTDKELNQMLPLKKLVGYDTTIGLKKRKIRKEHKAQKPDKKKRMTKYNVNADRLEAFDLKKNHKLNKLKQKTNNQPENDASRT